MTKQVARETLKNQKELKGHEIFNIQTYEGINTIDFTSCKGNKCYYGLYDDDGLSLEYAGKRSELQ